jgi:hypothetical protein
MIIGVGSGQEMNDEFPHQIITSVEINLYDLVNV